MNDLKALAEAEVFSRHVFFVEWFTGRAPDEEMQKCIGAFAPDFRIIWPDASEHDCGPLMELLRGAKGKNASDFAINVEIHHTAQLSDELLLLTFDEHQFNGDTKLNSRRGTAIFSRDENAPGRVVWRYLQETWIA